MNNLSKYVIYYLENCSFSKKALNLLIKYKLPYFIIYVSQENKNYYKNKLNKQTFPQIYYNNCNNNNNITYEIGGCDNLEQLFKKKL